MGRYRHGEAEGRNGKRCSHEYKVWANMQQRCFNAKCGGYQNYGGRDITVCKRWAVYTNFLADMGRCPAGLTLERKNNDGNYTPKNCKWATWTEQENNRRKRTLATHCRRGHLYTKENTYNRFDGARICRA